MYKSMEPKQKLPGSDLKTFEYLSKLPKVYLVACWARYGVRAFPFAGKFIMVDGCPIPLVYDYDDHNGECDYYWLRPITHTTTGFIKGWSFQQSLADAAAERFNDCAK